MVLMSRAGRKRLESLAFDTLPLKLAGPTNSLRLFASTPLRRLFVGPAKLHLAEDAFALHFLLQDLEGLIDIVVTNRYLHVCLSLIMLHGMKT